MKINITNKKRVSSSEKFRKLELNKTCWSTFKIFDKRIANVEIDTKSNNEIKIKQNKIEKYFFLEGTTLNII